MRLWARLKELQAMKDLRRDNLLKKLGVAQAQAGRVVSLVEMSELAEGQPVNPQTFCFSLRKHKLRVQRRREGRYLLRSNLPADNPGKLWEMYLLLAEIEAAFKSLKSDLRLRPIYHQLEERIQAHIFVAFLALCLHAILRGKLRPLAPGLTPRAVLNKLALVCILLWRGRFHALNPGREHSLRPATTSSTVSDPTRAPAAEAPPHGWKPKLANMLAHLAVIDSLRIVVRGGAVFQIWQPEPVARPGHGSYLPRKCLRR
jgi:hypothetical protein